MQYDAGAYVALVTHIVLFQHSSVSVALHRVIVNQALRAHCNNFERSPIKICTSLNTRPLSTDDHSRVTLKPFAGIEGSDYINASWLKVNLNLSTLHVVVLSFLLLSSIGLPTTEGLHSSSRSYAQLTGGLLAYDLGVQTRQHCHAHQVQGRRQGESATSNTVTKLTTNMCVT